MSILIETVSFFLKTAVSPPNFLSQKTKLIVGVSGGPDSLALLHVLTQVVDLTRLVVAHLNHGYRETAVSEAEFVRELAEQWGVACVVKAVDMVQLAQETGDSLEEAGRKARYAFFCEVAAAQATPYIMVGHHADDQAETVLMNLLRGTGLRGLQGMLPVSPLTGAPDFVLLRPFLTVSRQEIEVYCREQALSPVFDESNEDVSFFRNRIRQELLPLLTQYNAGIRAHLQQLADLAAADVAVLAEVVADTWAGVASVVDDATVVLDRAAWAALPLALRRAMLRQAVAVKRPLLQDLTFSAIEQARLVAERDETGQRVNLPGNLFLIVDYEWLFITDDEQITLEDWPQLGGFQPETLPIPGQLDLLNGWKLEARFVAGVTLPDIQAKADNWTVFVALPAGQVLQVRSRLAGERFQLLGMNGRSAKVKEVMINRKIGARWRARWPIVALPDHLLWLVGHNLDERMKITEKTTSIVQLRCYKG